MALRDILSYLEENEGKFPRETLISQLRKSGYPEEEIQSALKARAGTVTPAVYAKGESVWKKVAWWIGGFLAAWIFFVAAAIGMVILSIAAAFGSVERVWIFMALAGAAFLVVGAVFLFVRIRRRYPAVSWGILTATIIFTVVVIGMAIASQMVLFSLTDAREKARDARRITDIKQLQLALELYFDGERMYPAELNLLAPRYIPSVPRDPTSGAEYRYEKYPDGGYYMSAALENPNNPILQNDVNPGNALYEVSESSASVSDQGVEQMSDLGYALSGRPWGPEQATGPPDSPITLGDHETAWASLEEDDQDEWLLVSYDEPVLTKAILVYESYNPGALRRIDQVSGKALILLWQGKKDPVALANPPPGRNYIGRRYVARVELGKPTLISQIRLTIQSTEVPGWNEIDAVGLEDTQGNIHWATDAEASSSFAEPIPQGG